MHRAATAARATGFAAIDLGDQFAQVAALREIMPVRPMRAEYVVGILERATHSCGHSLLAAIEMHGALHCSVENHRNEAFLGETDCYHRSIQAEQQTPLPEHTSHSESYSFA